MLWTYSRLNWQLADGNGDYVRAISSIPFSINFAVYTIYKMHTILFAGTTSLAPFFIISPLWAAIKPIIFISFPMQPNPSMVVAASISQQVVNKLVFFLWFNHGKVCSQILAKYPWLVPCWGRRCITNVVAGFSVYQEPYWTSICSEIR